jgi:hypothetical protein
MSSDQPGYLKCTASTTPLFTIGVAYEVHSYENGKAWVPTEKGGFAHLPVEGCEFTYYDPWAAYRKRP